MAVSRFRFHHRTKCLHMGKRNTHYKNENQEKTDNIMNADDSIFLCVGSTIEN